jgi:hypothetical protein
MLQQFFGGIGKINIDPKHESSKYTIIKKKQKLNDLKNVIIPNFINILPCFSSCVYILACQLLGADGRGQLLHKSRLGYNPTKAKVINSKICIFFFISACSKIYFQ